MGCCGTLSSCLGETSIDSESLSEVGVVQTLGLDPRLQARSRQVVGCPGHPWAVSFPALSPGQGVGRWGRLRVHDPGTLRALFLRAQFMCLHWDGSSELGLSPSTRSLYPPVQDERLRSLGPLRVFLTGPTWVLKKVPADGSSEDSRQRAPLPIYSFLSPNYIWMPTRCPGGPGPGNRR